MKYSTRPHIHKWCGMWICRVTMFGGWLTGMGASPRAAYNDFIKRWDDRL